MRVGQGRAGRGEPGGTGSAPQAVVLSRCCPGAAPVPGHVPPFGWVCSRQVMQKPAQTSRVLSAVLLSLHPSALSPPPPAVTLGHMVALTSALAVSALSRNRGHASVLRVRSVRALQRCSETQNPELLRLWGTLEPIPVRPCRGRDTYPCPGLPRAPSSLAGDIPGLGKGSVTGLCSLVCSAPC